MIKDKTKKNYLSNKNLLKEFKESREKGQMNNNFVIMLQTLVTRFAKRKNFANYTYIDDMKAYAMLELVRTWTGFKPERSENAFAFFTQCVKHSFFRYLNLEKRQRNIRDSLLVNHGLSPSYTYQLEHHASQEDRTFAHDEESYEHHQNEVKQLREYEKTHHEVNNETP